MEQSNTLIGCVLPPSQVHAKNYEFEDGDEDWDSEAERELQVIEGTDKLKATIINTPHRLERARQRRLAEEASAFEQ